MKFNANGYNVEINATSDCGNPETAEAGFVLELLIALPTYIEYCRGNGLNGTAKYYGEILKSMREALYETESYKAIK